MPPAIISSPTCVSKTPPETYCWRATRRRDPVVINVIDKLLVTQVTSRPLTLEEIQERGIIIDQDNFTVLNFTVGLTVGSEQVVIDFPVLVPSTAQAAATIQAPQFSGLSGADTEQFRKINIPNFSLSGFTMRAPPEMDEVDRSAHSVDSTA